MRGKRQKGEGEIERGNIEKQLEENEERYIREDSDRKVEKVGEKRDKQNEKKLERVRQAMK
jgi:hypothetical protein